MMLLNLLVPGIYIPPSHCRQGSDWMRNVADFKGIKLTNDENMDVRGNKVSVMQYDVFSSFTVIRQEHAHVSSSLSYCPPCGN